MDTSVEVLSEITDIGGIIASSVYEYLNDEANRKLIFELKELGLNMECTIKSSSNNQNFLGKTFVVTGTLKDYSRDEIKDLIESLGGKCTGSVTKKTDVVIVGDSPGSKYQKAIDLNIAIWNEDMLNSVL